MVRQGGQLGGGLDGVGTEQEAGHSQELAPPVLDPISIMVMFP